jgi:hypothetical protein
VADAVSVDTQKKTGSRKAAKAQRKENNYAKFIRFLQTMSLEVPIKDFLISSSIVAEA